MKKIAAIGLLFILTLSPILASSHHRRHRPAQQSPNQSVQVWVNTASGVYHYQGERWYGRTKEGQYMTEAQAVKAGYRPTHNGQ